ncbi:protein translocase subunit SecD [Solemya velum gill symbiont]|uniref:Protein translocase subunit SecD n=1 Tax=Solemya velum gill symbiont TaxID=2340 RepID=A0A0B0HBT7_SOVGS|nr:protein translocase subunit SecD [Solemya velum gill symbiont]KHF24871.1 protein translocase SecABDEFGY-YidC-YajC-Ffh-FtsY, subunit D [Solemya velum gill symbiont]OOY51837.1 protein-export membrane protein SecD [Solemya velum gill symbiont]OOY55949.1 protein-export membrane protein SecD [Solemya velum gill symbiont]OOY57272.1 protein-export membrane protein SecD [Solemya velum gill symbiont]OOY60132.1 protein-export membrane protein SecD [Solemya velum gill symbiont]
MNHYPLWKNMLVVAAIIFAALYALPNLFGQDPSIEISSSGKSEITQGSLTQFTSLIEGDGVTIKRTDLLEDRALMRFNSNEDQLKAKERLESVLASEYNVALNLAADVPGWLSSLGAEPMNLGLDLRGGIHVLIDVDMDSAIEKALEGYEGDIRTLLREAKLRYTSVKAGENGVLIRFKDEEQRDQAELKVGNEFRQLKLFTDDDGANFTLTVNLTEADRRAISKFALEQNITTLRNRVNALGVSEPVIQQQGDRRIVVQLPGVQDPGRVKDILGATATLEYRLADTKHSVADALEGRIPVGSKLYYERNGQPILLKRSVIVTGDNITDASSGLDQQNGTPAVFVNLDGKGAKRMRKVTTDNVGQPMAVVFIENRIEGRDAEGKPIKRKVEEVISVANIREPFGRRFQTTGLDSTEEARNTALLLRAGALAAPIDIVEERTVGPSLGQDNIDQGFRSVVIGLILVMIFMGIYYRLFGLLANVALMFNLVMIVAVLSLLQATLTLPGIAGIVLTVGMAVDANVLIFERIREEIRAGSTPQASIHAGYEKAFSTIVDANITTLIAAVLLFSFGNGPVKGFAVTLFIGILTSMFTAIIGTRSVVNLIYGGKRVTKLSI